jgi:hypothetical protein
MIHQEIDIAYECRIGHQLPVNRFVDVETYGGAQSQTEKQAERGEVTPKTTVWDVDTFTSKVI